MKGASSTTSADTLAMKLLSISYRPSLAQTDVRNPAPARRIMLGKGSGGDAWHHLPGDYSLPVRALRNSWRYSPASSWRALVREVTRSEEHTSELQSRPHLVCRLLLE